MQITFTLDTSKAADKLLIQALVEARIIDAPKVEEPIKMDKIKKKASVRAVPRKSVLMHNRVNIPSKYDLDEIAQVYVDALITGTPTQAVMRHLNLSRPYSVMLLKHARKKVLAKAKAAGTFELLDFRIKLGV